MINRERPAECGAALVELAITIPLLIVVLFGVVDFARVFYTAVELTNAARAGAQYGALGTTNSSDTATMQSRAQAASPQIATYTVPTPTRSCGCMTQAGVFTSHGCTSACASSSEHLVVYVTVSATKSFAPIMSLPGLPQSVPITRSVTLRAQ